MHLGFGVTNQDSRPESSQVSVERPENGCALMLSIQPGGALEVLPRRMGDTSK